MPSASNELAGMESSPWSEAIVAPTPRTPARGDGQVPEDVAPANCNWHTFVLAQSPSDVGFPPIGVSGRFRGGMGVCLVSP